MRRSVIFQFPFPFHSDTTGIVPHVSFSFISSLAAERPHTVRSACRERSNRPSHGGKGGADWTDVKKVL